MPTFMRIKRVVLELLAVSTRKELTRVCLTEMRVASERHSGSCRAYGSVVLGTGARMPETLQIREIKWSSINKWTRWINSLNHNLAVILHLHIRTNNLCLHLGNSSLHLLYQVRVSLLVLSMECLLLRVGLTKVLQEVVHQLVLQVALLEALLATWLLQVWCHLYQWCPQLSKRRKRNHLKNLPRNQS